MVLQNIGGILLVDTAISSIFSPMSVCFNDMRYVSTIISMNQRLCLHFNDYQSFNDLKDTCSGYLPFALFKNLQKSDFRYIITVIPLYQNDGYSLVDLRRFVYIFALGKNEGSPPSSRRRQQSTGLLH